MGRRHEPAVHQAQLVGTMLMRLLPALVVVILTVAAPTTGTRCQPSAVEPHGVPCGLPTTTAELDVQELPVPAAVSRSGAGPALIGAASSTSWDGPFAGTTKVLPRGQALLLRFVTMPAVANTTLGIWIAIKRADGTWTAFRPHASATTDVAGIATYSYTSASPSGTWLAFRARYIDGAGAVVWSYPSLFGRWISASAPKSVPAPPPTATAGSPLVYGSAIGMDSLNNTQIGGSAASEVSYRFRALASGALQSVRVYVIGPNHDGYGAGTGGTWRVTVQPDDGTPAHAPTGTVLATSTLAHPADGFPLISFAAPATLVAGGLYHLVFRNVDPDPAANYASLDGVFMYRPTVPRQPRLADVDWGQLRRDGGGSWSTAADTIPIAVLTYADGATQGLGYMEVWVYEAQSISSAAEAREAFTVGGGDRTVSAVTVRLNRVAGSSPLTVRLETGSGTLVEQGTIPAAAFPVAGQGRGRGATWVTLAFRSSHLLADGQAYHLVLSAPADTTYSIFVIRKGARYGFPSATYFADGHAQYNPGSGWGPFTSGDGRLLDEADLQFYFS